MMNNLMSHNLFSGINKLKLSKQTPTSMHYMELNKQN